MAIFFNDGPGKCQRHRKPSKIRKVRRIQASPTKRAREVERDLQMEKGKVPLLHPRVLGLHLQHREHQKETKNGLEAKSGPVGNEQGTVQLHNGVHPNGKAIIAEIAMEIGKKGGEKQKRLGSEFSSHTALRTHDGRRNGRRLVLSREF